jgi:hypothetical protein
MHTNKHNELARNDDVHIYQTNDLIVIIEFKFMMADFAAQKN